MQCTATQYLRRISSPCPAICFLFACTPPPPPQYGPGQGGSSGPGGKPGWVDGRSGRFPDMQYLKGERKARYKKLEIMLIKAWKEMNCDEWLNNSVKETKTKRQ